MSAIEFKICALPQCNEQFPTTNKRRKYCSPECGKEADRQKSRERYKKKRARELGDVIDINRNVTAIEKVQPSTASPLYFKDIIDTAFVGTHNRLAAVESAILELLTFFPINSQLPEEPRLKRAILLKQAAGNDLALWQTCKVLMKILRISQREAQDLLLLADKFLRETTDPAQTSLKEFVKHGGQ
ncbi:MAG: CGNR zinc finger domain-containing protein [Candidatus Aureabacteria bacterium]|nr:CGNR zinc finger domain-containing protein [Candidatus Auribacterota bacterium]